MQTISNGLYWLWWNAEGQHAKKWFLIAIRNGHVAFVGHPRGPRLSAGSIMLNNTPFQLVTERELEVFDDMEKVTEEQLLEKLEPPKFTPYDYIKYNRYEQPRSSI
jgi:hypothetical protein